MIFSRDEMPIFRLEDKEFPMWCDLVVLEKIQNEVGDIIVAEDKLRGFVPRVDADGVIDRTDGTFTIPDIGLVTKVLHWCLEEGKEVCGEDYEIPSETDLKQQEEYNITALSMIVHSQFADCISGKKKRVQKTQKK